MLNRRERYQALEFFRLCSKLGPLPLQVDLASRDITRASRWKQWICTVSYSIFLLHGLYKNSSLVYAFFFMPDVQLHHLIVHAVLAMGSVMLAFWYHTLYVSSPSLVATFVKMTIAGNVGGTPLDLSDGMNKGWRSRVKEYSMQDLIATSVSYLAVVAAALICASYVYDPSMKLLLYAALPTHLQNWATFGLCLLEEFRFIVIMVAIAVPIWQLQVVSSGLVSTQLQQSIKAIENGRQSCRGVYRFLRCLQLYMSIFNKVNCYLIFTWKLACISVCIMSGYAAIAHFREHPVFGILYYVILFDCILMYSLSYGKAFKIPELFCQTAACAMLYMHRNRMGRNGLLRRQIKSIPPTGVKVGHFHTMERVSTLIFMNYVLVNIVNMLVAYGCGHLTSDLYSWHAVKAVEQLVF